MPDLPCSFQIHSNRTITIMNADYVCLHSVVFMFCGSFAPSRTKVICTVSFLCFRKVLRNVERWKFADSVVFVCALSCFILWTYIFGVVESPIERQRLPNCCFHVNYEQLQWIWDCEKKICAVLCIISCGICTGITTLVKKRPWTTAVKTSYSWRL